MINRRTFLLGIGAGTLTPIAGSLLTFEQLPSAGVLAEQSVDPLQQKYPFACMAVLKLACWNDFLEMEDQSLQDTSQVINLSASWKVF